MITKEQWRKFIDQPAVEWTIFVLGILFMKAVLSHPDVGEWIDKAQDEPWVIEHYEHEPA